MPKININDLSFAATATFDASAKTIDFTPTSTFDLNNILAIINTTQESIIYEVGNPLKGGTWSGDTLSLTFDTTSHSDTDKLIIYLDYPDGSPIQTIGTNVVSISGNVTANAGTNLNTSALALESGGNLAAIAASLSIIDDWDESDRAKTNPIVGQAGVAGGSGNVSATTQRVTLATDVALPSGNNVIGQVKISDGTDVADVLDLTNSNPLTVAVVDGAGNQITSFGGGVEYTEGDTDSAITGKAVLMEASSNTLVPLQGNTTDGLLVNLGSNNDITGTVTVNGDIAHDSSDSGNPVKVGGKATTGFSAVSNGDRTNFITDVYGRLLIAKIDPSMQVWKSANYTTTQTGTAIWTPGSGKKIVVTHCSIYSYGATSGKCILWFGASGDTTYTAGTDQPLTLPSFAPSTTSKPGLVLDLSTPVFCLNADYILRCTTDANLSLEIIVYGYEI